MTGDEQGHQPYAHLGDPDYPQVLPPHPEPLAEVLERTHGRASLAPEYLDGRAPASQARQGQVVDPAPTYYGLPAIKKPDWEWYIPAYFVTGGMAAGGYILAAVADMSGRAEDRPLVRAGRVVALAMLGASPPLLIMDLGRPERFHHMLRVFRPRSMMNQGSWGLTIFGGFVALTTLMELASWVVERVEARGERGEGGGPGCLTAPALSPTLDVMHGKLRGKRGGVQALSPLSSQLSPLKTTFTTALRAFTWLGIIPAAYVGSYTGVLLSATNVPLWARNRYFLGPLFFASALSSGAGATHLAANMLGPVSEEAEERLHAAETAALATEGALTAASMVTLGSLGKPLQKGKVSTLFKVGYLGLGLVAPLVLRHAGRKNRWAGLAASVLSIGSAAALKFAMTEGGKESADDPHAYFEYTRAEGKDRE